MNKEDMIPKEFPQLGTKEFNDLASAYFGGEPKEMEQSNEKPQTPQLNISDVSDSKKYVYKYNHNGKDLFYYVDDVEGDMFVSDINDARVFTGKQIKSFQLDSAFDIGNEIYCDEEGGYITLTEKPTRIEV